MEPRSSISPDGASAACGCLSRVRRIRRPSLLVACIAGVLLIHVGMGGWLAARWSPNVDEPAHLAAGLAGWQYGSFEFYCVNPPLVRAVATLPVLAMSPERQWGDFCGSGVRRPEFGLGAQLLESHPDRWRSFLLAGRWAILPFSIVGALFCYAWASELFGRKAGLLALVLWCFSPNILTWSSVICTDGAAAALGVGAGYTFWRWLKCPSWPRALAAGVMLGAAELAKMTWLPLFALWTVLWVFCLMQQRRKESRTQQCGQLASIFLLGLYVLNLGYAFDGSLTKLGDYRFHSRLLTGESQPPLGGPGQNRFADSLLEHIPVPLPQYYVRGLDLQRADFEYGRPSYLLGEWSDRGWWYYYLLGLALKVPLGTWGLAILAVAFTLAPFRRKEPGETPESPAGSGKTVGGFDQIVLLAPAFMVLALACSQDGFSRHFRYVLPVLPFAYIWMSKVVGWLRRDNVVTLVVFVFCLAWALGSSLAVFPHSMSYFNEIAGGPRNGHRYMLHAAFSWSQDDFYLKRWLESRPEIDAPYLYLERSVSLERLGLRGRGEPPKSIASETERYDPVGRELGPIPGWHVVSLQNIHESDGGYLYFFSFEPVARAGYSIYIYHVTLEDANEVRRTMGLREIRARERSPDAVKADLATGAASSRPVHAAIFAMAGVKAGPAKSIRNAVASDPSLSMTYLSPDDIAAGQLNSFDVLIVPGGRATEQGNALGRKGRQAIRQFVESGGGYVGICAGAYLATAKYPWSLGLINAQTMTGTSYVPGLGEQTASARGSGSVEVELTDSGQEVFMAGTNIVHMSYMGGPILFPANEYSLPEYLCLAQFRSEVWKHAFQRGTMIDTPAIVAAQCGEGRVILFCPHLEGTPGLESWLIRSTRACARRGESGMSGVHAGVVELRGD